MRRSLTAVCAVFVFLLLRHAALADTVRGQILDYQNGYVILTTGESYRLAEAVRIVDASSGQQSSLKPVTGLYAQLALDAQDHVSEIALARSATSSAFVRLPTVEGVHVPLTAPVASKPQSEFAPVTFVALVPATTLTTDQVYMSTSETSWAPTAVRMDRLDARHFRVIINVPVGSSFLYLYTRGSPQSLERGANGLQRPARSLVLSVATGQQTIRDVIEHWGDEVGTSLLPPPQTFPTPYNPAPFPNLPSPRP